jgi:predicted transposase YdaD
MLDITLKETRLYRDIKEEVWQEGREEGRHEEAANLVIRLLTKRVGKLPQDLRAAVADLPLPVLEELGEALLDFTSIAELQAWLAKLT